MLNMVITDKFDMNLNVSINMQLMYVTSIVLTFLSHVIFSSTKIINTVKVREMVTFRAQS